MLLIYYNPQKNHFYLKKVNLFIFDKEVGYVNQFGHVLIQALFIYENKFISCSNYFDYCNKTKEIYKQKELDNQKIKNKFRLVTVLYQLLDKKRKK